MCFEWKPELGTRVMVVSRDSLEVEALVRLPDPAPTCYHIINAFEEKGPDGDDVVSLQICEQANGDRSQLELQAGDVVLTTYGVVQSEDQKRQKATADGGGGGAGALLVLRHRSAVRSRRVIIREPYM